MSNLKSLTLYFLVMIFIASVAYYERLPIARFLIANEFIVIKAKESKLAHQFLDNLKGIEVGASNLNPFGLNTLNVDYSDTHENTFEREEFRSVASYTKVDVVASGDALPFEDNSVDFVVSSHVIEHFYDPVKTMKEWLRVVRPGGYVYVIAPHKERTFDRDKERTTLAELIDRHEHPNPPFPDHHNHYSFWITQDFLDLCQHYQWKVVASQDVDDKVGNGFTVVIQKDLMSERK